MNQSWFDESPLLAGSIVFCCPYIEGECSEGMLTSCKPSANFADNRDLEVLLTTEEIHFSEFQETIIGCLTIWEAVW